MGEKDWLFAATEKNQVEAVLKSNQYTEKFGLALSDEDAKLLVKERGDTLKEQQRVEFGGGILEKLIFEFCDSPYVFQDNYVDVLGRLQEIFYLYKNESLDELTDDELIDFMKEKFDGECEGDLDYLEGTILDEFAREIRSNTRKFIGRYKKK